MSALHVNPPIPRPPRCQTAVEQTVREESARFRAALPLLLDRYPEKWVVFKDGEVQRVFDDEETAFVEAVRTYGIDTGFVIAQVIEDPGPIPITAGIYFGMFSS